MRLGYIHFDRSEQKKYMAVINRLLIGGAIDELGVGRIRDYYSDKMFPGISSLHQHAKYFILLPLLYREAVKYKYSSPRDVRPQIVKLEKDLTEVLYNRSTIKIGITGSDFIGKKGYVRYDPTYIYATGLFKFGILLCDSLEEMIFDASRKYHERPIKLNASDDENGDSDDLYNAYQFCHVPTDLGYDWKTQSTLDLTKGESEFLIKHITGSKVCQGSLLVHVINTRMDITNFDEFKDFAASVDKSRYALPEQLKRDVTNALNFARLVDGLYLRYNYLFSNKTDEDKNNEFLKWVDDVFSKYRDGMKESVVGLKISDNGSIPFCLGAITAIENNDYKTLDDKIIRRERDIKQTRHKIGNNAYRYDSKYPIHKDSVQFRWETVRKLLHEIYKGLNNV